MDDSSVLARYKGQLIRVETVYLGTNKTDLYWGKISHFDSSFLTLNPSFVLSEEGARLTRSEIEDKVLALDKLEVEDGQEVSLPRLLVREIRKIRIKKEN